MSTAVATKELNCLCCSGNLWHGMIEGHHRRDFGLTAPILDFSLYYLLKDVPLNGLSATYVNYMLRYGDAVKSLASTSKEIFKMADDKNLATEYIGFQVETHSGDSLILSQKSYLKTLE